MSIPTHNLYDFVHQALENKCMMYYFYPFGSRDLKNLISYYNLENNDFLLEEFSNHSVYKQIFSKKVASDVFGIDWTRFQPHIICNDQEPLSFEFYHKIAKHFDPRKNNCFEPFRDVFKDLNLDIVCAKTWQKYIVLLHSELNSPEVDRYESTGKFICAYWWSHAMLARDWYRFAEYDKRLILKNKNIEKLFLIYSRSSSGSRAYRQNFLQMLEDKKISNQLQIGSFNGKMADSDHSAIYNVEDFNKSAISVVLETVFDERIHLTEKILRPIACGHPFLLANGPGSLKYLRKYGFKTFHPYINESYDQEENNDIRLQMIGDEIERICNLNNVDQQELLNQCQKIANFNKKLFFSSKFLNHVTQELIVNVTSALHKTNNELDWQKHFNLRRRQKQIYPDAMRNYDEKQRQKYIVPLIKHLKKGGTLEDYVPPDLD